MPAGFLLARLFFDKIHVMYKIVFWFLAGMLPCLSLRAQADGDAVLPRDPEVVAGKLPNGITYYLRHNEVPKGQACFYIIRNAGSLMEEEGEEGLAHFLEHMAFQGTENFPGKGIIDMLERHGVLFGYDINAVTSENETTYTISGVPTHDKKLLDSCMMVMRDWSYYLTLDADEIDAERGVIAEEWHMRNTPESRIQDQVSKVIFQGSKYAGRDVIGSFDVIQNFKPEALRAFYHKWYRTDLEAVVVVGDFDVKAMEARVKKYLSGVPAEQNPVPRPFYEIPEHEEMYYCMATDPAVQASSMQVVTLVPDVPKEVKGTVAYLKHQSMTRLFGIMIDRRMGEVLAQPDCLIRNGGISYIFFKRGYYSYQIGAVPKAGEAEALRAILTENERLLRYGFTEGELQEAKAELLKTLEYGYRARNNIKNDAYAQQLRDHFLKGEPVVAADDEYRLTKDCISAITVEDMDALVKSWNTEKNRTFIVSGSEYGWHIMEDEVLEIMAEVKAADIAPWQYQVLQATAAPLLTEELPGGKMVAEKRLPAFGAVEWTLSNGAKVVYRESTLEMNEMSLKAYSPGGTSLYGIDMLPSAESAAQLVSAFGLGDDDMNALQAKLAGKRLACQVAIHELSETVTGSAVPEDVETLLQLVYLRFAHPRFDREEFDKIMEQNRRMLPAAQGNLQQVLRDSVKRMQGNYHPRVLLMDADYLSKVDFDKVKQVYTERFSNAADFTFFITGSLPAEELKPLVEKYIGSIPSTGAHEQWKDNGIRGPQGKMERKIRMPFPAPQALVTVNVSKPMEYNCYNNICLQVLKNLVQSRCMASMREGEGGTYAVNVYDASAYEPIGKYDLTVEFQCNPANAERLKAMVYAELDRLKQEAPTGGEMQRALANIAKKRLEAQGTNDYWMGAMQQYEKTGIDMNLSKNFDKIVDRLTSEDMLEFVQEFLTNANIADIVFYSGEL